MQLSIFTCVRKFLMNKLKENSKSNENYLRTQINMLIVLVHKIYKFEIRKNISKIVMRDYEKIWPEFLDEICTWKKENMVENENNLQILKLLGLLLKKL